MKQFIFISWVTFFFCCTTTKSPIDPIRPEIDFVSSSYFTPTEINKFKRGVKCDEMPYWEGQTVKLQGFLFSGNISATNKRFFVYDNINVFDTSNEAIVVHFQSKDSATILKAIFDTNNKDKHCLIKAACLTKETYIESCVRLIQFTLTKPEDLEFK
jgi:hypothetical protein